MFSNDQNHQSAVPSIDRTSGESRPPRGEWGWVVTPDGRVRRATVSDGEVRLDTERSRAA